MKTIKEIFDEMKKLADKPTIILLDRLKLKN